MSDNQTESNVQPETEGKGIIETITTTISNTVSGITETIKNLTGTGKPEELSEAPVADRVEALQRKLPDETPVPTFNDKVHDVAVAAQEKLSGITDKIGLTDPHASGVSNKSIEARAEILETKLEGSQPAQPSLTEKATDAAHAVGEKIKATTAAAQEKIGEVSDKIGLTDPHASGVSNKSIEARADILETKLEGTAQPSLSEKVTGAALTVGEKIKDTAAVAHEKVTDVTEKIGLTNPKDPHASGVSNKSIEDRADILATKLEGTPAQPSLSEKVMETAAAAKEKLSGLSDKVGITDPHASGVSNKSIEARADILETKLEGSHPAQPSLSEKATDAAHAVGEKIKATTAAAQEQIGHVSDKIGLTDPHASGVSNKSIEARADILETKLEGPK